jgi:hypothetical protein
MSAENMSKLMRLLASITQFGYGSKITINEYPVKNASLAL